MCKIIIELFLLFPFLIILFGWIFKELTMGICKCGRLNEKRLRGKVVIITGATSGIGFQTAVEIAKRGAQIIIGCRNLEKGKKCSAEISRLANISTNKMMVIPVQIDLASKQSIDDFVRNVMTLVGKVNILINNAGVAGNLGARYSGHKAEKNVTPDGFEQIMATNYLGHVYLTYKLQQLIQIGATENVPSAVIHLSSFGHLMGVLDPSDIDLNSEKKEFVPEVQYCTSKLALLHFSNILGKKFQKENWNCVSVAVNPGLVRTNIFDQSSGLVSTFMGVICWIFGKSSWQGAQTTLHVAMRLSECRKKELNKKYFSDCREETVFVSEQIGNKEVEKTLWKATQKMLEIEF